MMKNQQGNQNQDNDPEIDNTPDQNPESQPITNQPYEPGQSHQSNPPMKDTIKKDFQPDSDDYKKKSQQQSENEKQISQQKRQQQQQQQVGATKTAECNS